MKSHLLKALLATVLLALGLTKASAAIDPSLHNSAVAQGVGVPDMPTTSCIQGACNYLA